MKKQKLGARFFLLSFFGLHTRQLASVVIGSAMVTGIVDEIMQIGMDHHFQFIAINAIIIADFITGLILAHRQKRIETHRAKKIIFDIVGYNFAVFLMYMMAKAYPVLSFTPDMVAVPIIIINAFSFIKNLSLIMGKKTVFLQIFYNIDRYKNDYIQAEREKLSEQPPPGDGSKKPE